VIVGREKNVRYILVKKGAMSSSTQAPSPGVYIRFPDPVILPIARPIALPEAFNAVGRWK